MNAKKQLLLIEYLISSPDVFAICQGIVQPKYFDPEFREGVKFIKWYYQEYNALPDVGQVEAETDLELKPRTVTRDQFSYCCNEIEVFCRHSAIREAIIAAPKLLEAEDFGKLEKSIKDAITISLTKDLGTDFFSEVRETLTRLIDVGKPISTGWRDVDDVLFGGVQRKQLLLFSAGSGGGKSVTMQNFGLNLVQQGMNVLYLSLELSEELLAERMTYMLSGIGRTQLSEKMDDAVYAVSEFASMHKVGKMIFKQMPSGINANDIKSYLKEYELTHGHIPDAIIVDYLDLMSPMDKVSADNVFEKDKRVAEELRNIAVEDNLMMITASQLNRSAVGAEVINHSMIAGGISKINTCDLYITIILSETLKAAGEIAFHYQKTRNSDGVGKTTYLAWGKSTLRISNKEQNSGSSLIAPPKVLAKEPEKKKKFSNDLSSKGPKKSLSDMISDSDLDMD